jgi:hypothetical protein
MFAGRLPKLPKDKGFKLGVVLGIKEIALGQFVRIFKK